MCAKPTFNWEDPFLFSQQLTEEERMIMDAAPRLLRRPVDDPCAGSKPGRDL